MTANAARSPVTAADLARFPEIGAVGLSADGQLVAAIVSVPDTSDNLYQRNVVVGSAAGHAPLQQLTPAADGREELGAWSPAGHILATVRHDEDGWSIWVHDVDGSASPVVTGWPDPVEELSWSPAGDRLLFVAREPTDRGWWQLPEDRRPPLRITTLRHREDGIGWTVNRPRQAYVVAPGPAGGSSAEPRRVSAGGYDDAEFGWHPDGRRVVFVSQRQPDADHTIVNDVFLQDVDSGGAPVRLTATTHACAQPRVSPDGALVAFTATDVPRFPATAALAIVPVSGEPAAGNSAGGGEVTILSGGLDRDCSNLIWTDAGHVTVLADDRGAIHAYRFDVSGPDQCELIIGGERRVSSFDQRGGTRVFVITSPDQPPQLVAQSGDGRETVLLAPSANAAAVRDIRGPQYRQVRASDGTGLDSWLTLPDPDRWQPPYPLLLCLQGGGTQYGYQWSPEFQALLGAGFATLYLNPRGSAGYGTAWMRTVSGPHAATPGTGWGTVDIQDVLTVVRDVLASRPELDASRVGVQGGSYGGLVTTWLLAASDDFAAGWAERGPYNLFSLAGTNDESPWFFQAYLGRSVTEDPAAYWATSTLRLAEGITAPVAIVHSEEDRRCPIQQAEELFMALRLLGRTVEFYRFPGESHGLSRTGSPVHRVQRTELLIEWFSRWLSPRARSETGDSSKAATASATPGGS
jgi:dipeptidyl aminopeptidase/acylaminoacyl peptidase